VVSAVTSRLVRRKCWFWLPLAFEPLSSSVLRFGDRWRWQGGRWGRRANGGSEGDHDPKHAPQKAKRATHERRSRRHGILLCWWRGRAEKPGRSAEENAIAQVNSSVGMVRGARVRWFLAKRRSVGVRGFRAGRLPSFGAPFGRDSILHACGGHLHMCHRGDRLAPSIGSSRRSGTEPHYRARQKDSHHANGMQAAQTHRREEANHRKASGKELPSAIESGTALERRNERPARR